MSSEKFRSHGSKRTVAGVTIRNRDLGVRTRRYMIMVMGGLAIGRRDQMAYDPDSPPTPDDMTPSEMEDLISTLHEPELATAALEFVRKLATGPFLSPDRMVEGEIDIVQMAREVLGMPALVASDDGEEWKEDN